jgi:hypothetical protein
MKILTSTLFIIVLFFAVLAQAGSQKQIVWEYKFVNEATEILANGMGADGWELAGVEPATYIYNIYRPPTYVFKRVKK